MFSDEIDERTKEIGKFVVATGATVREAAKHFGISKSTVHKDLSERLKQTDTELFHAVERVLSFNLAQRHIRGGMATKMKYALSQKPKSERRIKRKSVERKS